MAPEAGGRAGGVKTPAQKTRRGAASLIRHPPCPCQGTWTQVLLLIGPFCHHVIPHHVTKQMKCEAPVTPQMLPPGQTGPVFPVSCFLPPAAVSWNQCLHGWSGPHASRDPNPGCQRASVSTLAARGFSSLRDRMLLPLQVPWSQRSFSIYALLFVLFGPCYITANERHKNASLFSKPGWTGTWIWSGLEHCYTEITV